MIIQKLKCWIALWKGLELAHWHKLIKVGEFSDRFSKFNCFSCQNSFVLDIDMLEKSKR